MNVLLLITIELLSWFEFLFVGELEIFYTLKATKVLIEGWRREYNTIRPYSSLGYKQPEPEAMQPSSCTPCIIHLNSDPLMKNTLDF